MIEVLEMNGLATAQDFSRAGWMSFGVPASGPMDRFAFRAANQLAGNSLNDAAVEVGLGDVTFRALRDCVIAVAGVGYKLSVYIWDFPLWGSFFVRSGWTIRLTKIDSGMWAYLAIAGGVQTQPVLGSRSTYLRGALGGLNGSQLQTGDRLECGIPSASLDDLAGRTMPIEVQPAYSMNPTIEVIMGPQADYFTQESCAEFLSSEYSISLTSDRMGYRLDGPLLNRSNPTELISEGMNMGSIQVSSNGQPIVMMADAPTTGGYPKIASVISADLPILAQCTPNKSKIRFRETTVAKAQKKYRSLINKIESSIVGQDEN